MSTVAVIGEGATTTALALTCGWPAGLPVVCVEADPSGGDLAAWLDVPRAGGLAAAAALPAPGWPAIETLIETAPGGLRLLAAPTRSIEATATVGEASQRVMPILAALTSPTFVVDCGRHQPAGGLTPVALQALLVVVPVLQHRRSSRAAAVHIERIAELCDLLAGRAIPTVLAVIGARPYSAAEIVEFVSSPGVPLDSVVLAVDDWSAAVLGGRAGSARRLARGALLRSAASAAALVAGRMRSVGHELPAWDAP